MFFSFVAYKFYLNDSMKGKRFIPLIFDNYENNVFVFHLFVVNVFSYFLSGLLSREIQLSSQPRGHDNISRSVVMPLVETAVLIFI